MVQKKTKKVDYSILKNQNTLGRLKKMTNNIDVIKLKEPNQILPSYKKAYFRKDLKNTILVEYGDYYNEK